MPDFHVEDVRLHVELDGERGPWVVLLHGALAAGAAYRSQRVALRDEFRLAVPDLRGHGRSSHYGRDVPWETMGLGRMARDVHGLVDQLSPGEPVHLVGVSMGGLVSARVAYERPERVASLTLLSTSGTGSEKRRRFFAEMTPETLPRATQRLSALWHGDPYWRELATRLFAHFASQSGEQYPPRLRVPKALVVQATHDEILEPSEAEAWVDRIDAPVTLVRAPGDHAFFADGRAGSRAANAALRSFLLGP